MKKLFFVVAIILSPLFYSNAFGCGCVDIGLTAEQAKAERLKDFEHAATIFTGEVVELQENKVRFKVERIWKGNSVDEVTMTIWQGESNGKTVPSSCDYYFESGEKYLVYADQMNDSLSTAACSRTVSLKQVERAKEEIRALDEIRLPEIKNTKSRSSVSAKNEI